MTTRMDIEQEELELVRVTPAIALELRVGVGQRVGPDVLWNSRTVNFPVIVAVVHNIRNHVREAP